MKSSNFLGVRFILHSARDTTVRHDSRPQPQHRLFSTQSRQNVHSKVHIIASLKQALDLGHFLRKGKKGTSSDFDPQMPSGSCSEPTESAAANAERDMPRRRMTFVIGNCALSSSTEISSNTMRPSITPCTERLRVICWKSAYLIFSVTVRPRVPVFSQLPHT